MNAKPLLHLSEVHYRHTGVEALLEGVELTVSAGEHIGILGASGSGKTTLLNCCASRIIPQGGALVRAGKVATIYQDLRLVTQATVLENVLHGALGARRSLRIVRGFSATERATAMEKIARVGLAHRSDAAVATLSGGERQRVAIARALMMNPQIILADEPVASLDEVTTHGVMRLLDDLAKREEIALISVLHDRELATRYCTRVLMLRRGVLEPLDERTLPSELPGPISEELKSTTLAVDEGAGLSVEPLRSAQAPRPSVGTTRHTVRRISKFGIPLALMILVAWAAVGLPIEWENAIGSGGRLIRFMGGLFPQSGAELTELPWATLSNALVETICMAIVGTAMGCLIALPLAVAATEYLAPRLVREPVRVLLNVIRAVPSLLWALLFVAAVGFGPLAGVLALAVYSVGYLSKFFYEGFESIDRKAIDALAELGAGATERFRFAVWPAARAVVFSSCFFVLEYNVRAATVLGLVDAGGIGTLLKQYVDFRQFPAVLAGLFLILLVVLALDTCSRRLRLSLVRS